jgi:hypothetical protein
MEYMAAKSLAHPIQIFGTDISDEALETARTGRYIENIARNVSADRLARFFTRDGDYFRVSNSRPKLRYPGRWVPLRPLRSGGRYGSQRMRDGMIIAIVARIAHRLGDYVFAPPQVALRILADLALTRQE